MIYYGHVSTIVILYWVELDCIIELHASLFDYTAKINSGGNEKVVEHLTKHPQQTVSELGTLVYLGAL